MKNCWLKYPLASLRLAQQQIYAALPITACLNLVICLQEIAVEDFEYYAAYESNLFDLGVSFLTFKPIEYLCEVAFEAMLQQRLSLKRAF